MIPAPILRSFRITPVRAGPIRFVCTTLFLLSLHKSMEPGNIAHIYWVPVTSQDCLKYCTGSNSVNFRKSESTRYGHSQLTDEETELHRGYLTCPQSHSSVAEPGLKPRQPGLQHASNLCFCYRMSFHVNVLNACSMSGLVLLESFPQHTARKRLRNSWCLQPDNRFFIKRFPREHSRVVTRQSFVIRTTRV